MKVVAVQGSPNAEGNTALLLKSYLEGVKENHANITIDEIFVQEKNIGHCKGCLSCKTSSDICAIQDDMQGIYGKVSEADALIFATPVYWWNISSQLKKFMDRLYGLDYEDLENKKFVLLMTYEGELPNSGPPLVESIFREICQYLGMEFVQLYGVCTGGDISVEENADAQKTAYELGKNLLSIKKVIYE